MDALFINKSKMLTETRRRSTVIFAFGMKAMTRGHSTQVTPITCSKCIPRGESDRVPVTVKQIRQIGNGVGVAALIDVYSDTAHQNLIYQNLTVITAANSRIAMQLQSNPNWQTYLLGFFSVNLRKAIEIASGHSGIANAVAAPGALEFFAFGVPLQKAVSQSTPCTEEDD